MKYDIFISYKRRDVSSAVAAFIYDMLLRQGYSVFFDRKEMRTGRFDVQLLEHISNAKDIIILFEQTSLSSWYDTDGAKRDGEDAYKEDWFCREVMHALKLTNGDKEKNIIPLMLNGYEFPNKYPLPQEMTLLNTLQQVKVESWCLSEKVEEIKANFLSMPVNLALSRQMHDGTSMVGRFLFYTSAASCDIYEFGVQAGERLLTITDQNDEAHAFCYPVAFAGEHRFKFINNDTCEEVVVQENIAVNSQKFIEIKFHDYPFLWKLNKEEIEEVTDAAKLYRWGKCLYEGNIAHQPDIQRSFQCLSRSHNLGCTAATDFICRHCVGLIRQLGAEPIVAIQWYILAAELGSKEGLYNLASMYRHGRAGVERNLDTARKYYEESAKLKYIPAICKLGEMYDRHLKKNQAPDYVEASKWHRMAAEMGNPRSMRNLAIALYLQNQKMEALEWAEKAIVNFSIQEEKNEYLSKEIESLKKDQQKSQFA